MFLDEILLASLFIFVGLSIFFLGGNIVALLRRGLNCLSAFSFMWFFAYVVPTLVYLMFPEAIAGRQSYAWIDLDQWCLTVLIAALGLILFGLGYWFGKKYCFRLIRISEYFKKEDERLHLLFLWIALALQLYPILRVVLGGISINFAHRAIHWQQVGPTIRLAFFSLPSVAIAYSLFLSRKSFQRILLLVFTLLVSTFSVLLLGTRMFVVLVFFVLFLLYTNRNPRLRFFLFALLLILALLMPGGYSLLLRNEENANPQSVFLDIILGDLGRVHTLAYTLEHANLVNSNLVHPPILGSYFYWLILPIPRDLWEGKPYATNLQFSFYFRREHTSFYVPNNIADLVGSTEFGFIDEAVLNLGILGLVIIFLFGWLAAKLDKWGYGRQYLSIIFPLFFLLGVIYTFNGILNYLIPFLLFGFILDNKLHVRILS